MSWYSTGTVNVTNGSAAVTGVGTAWLAAIGAGWGFVGPDGRTYQVLSVNSDTSITLARNYAGTSLTGQQYDLFPTQGFLRTLLTSIQSLISSVTSMLTGAGAGRFGDGTASAPGISFSSDPDTGFRRPSSNVLAMVTGAVDRVFVTAAGNVGIGTPSPARALHISAAEPAVVTEESDGAADAKIWRQYQQGGSLILDAVNDAFSASQMAYRVERSGISVTSHIWSTAGSDRVLITSVGNLVLTAPPTASVSAPSGSRQMTWSLDSDSVARLSVRCGDGVLRYITLPLSA